MGGSAKETANWVLNELFRLMKDASEPMERLSERMPPPHVAAVIELVSKGSLSRTSAKQVFEASFSSGKAPAAIVAEQGLSQISDSDALSELARQVLADERNAKAVAEYRGGKTSTMQYLVGQLMRVSKGQANPQVARTVLEEALARK